MASTYIWVLTYQQLFSSTYPPARAHQDLCTHKKLSTNTYPLLPVHQHLFFSVQHLAISSVTICYYLCNSTCPPTPIYSYLSSWNYAGVFIYAYLLTSIHLSVPTHYSLFISTYDHHLFTDYVYPSTSTCPYLFTTLFLTLPISMCLPNRSIDFYSPTKTYPTS